MNARNDGLAELLVQLAGNAAALIDKARASGAFRPTTVDGETVVRPAAAAPAEEKQPADATAGALQDIIVQQAMRMHVLEGEVAQLTKELTAARSELAAAQNSRLPARKKSATKKSAARTA